MINIPKMYAIIADNKNGGPFYLVGVRLAKLKQFVTAVALERQTIDVIWGRFEKKLLKEHINPRIVTFSLDGTEPAQVLVEALEAMLEHTCDGGGEKPCSQMWFQDVAEEALAMYFKLCKEKEKLTASETEVPAK